MGLFEMNFRDRAVESLEAIISRLGGILIERALRAGFIIVLSPKQTLSIGSDGIPGVEL